jgi:predicted TIM-barrel fold metal-dependent hydrolase
MGALPNVTMKLSGLGHFSREPEPHRDARDLVRRVADAFGPRRLAWSSGSPSIVDAHLDDWPEADRAWVKGLNLARLARFTA